MSTGRFEGQVAFVTGAASGIGRATAARLVREGAKVVLADRDAPALETTALDLARADVADAVVCDIANAASVTAAIAASVARHGRIDVLANVAGVTPPSKRDAEDVDPADLAEILAVNLVGTMSCIQNVLPLMKRQGYGRIVNVASIAAIMPTTRGNTPYAMSKGGVVALTRQLVLEVSPFGITINAIAPGLVLTPILERRGPAQVEAMQRYVPVGRLGRPEEIASAIAFLAAPEAGFITGHLLVVDGGMTAVSSLGMAGMHPEAHRGPEQVQS